MDVKEAIAAAKDYVHSLYDESEGISDVRLEEVEFDPSNDEWRVTVEFSRQSNDGLRTRARELIEAHGRDVIRRRVQKVVVVSDTHRKAVAMKNREAA